MPAKSDWKLFSQRLADYRERYLQERSKDFAQMLQAPNKTGTEQFWDTHEAMQKEAKKLRRLLDGYSKRDTEMLFAILIREGIAQVSDFAEYSEELQADVRKSLGL